MTAAPTATTRCVAGATANAATSAGTSAVARAAATSATTARAAATSAIPTASASATPITGPRRRTGFATSAGTGAPAAPMHASALSARRARACQQRRQFRAAERVLQVPRPQDARCAVGAFDGAHVDRGRGAGADGEAPPRRLGRGRDLGKSPALAEPPPPAEGAPPPHPPPPLLTRRALVGHSRTRFDRSPSRRRYD